THVVTEMSGYFPAYLLAFVPVIEIVDGLALVVYPVVDDMSVRMFFVRMQYGHILCVFDTYLFHVFQGMLCHFFHREFYSVLIALAKDGMSNGIADLGAFPCAVAFCFLR